MNYKAWALVSALSAGATALLAKKGVEEVPTNLALAVRVFFILLIAIAIAFASGQTALFTISKRAWLYLFLSAVATGVSWLAYFRALKLGPISRVAPIDKLSFVVAMVLGILFLGEKTTPRLVGGAVLIIIGVLLTLGK